MENKLGNNDDANQPDKTSDQSNFPSDLEPPAPLPSGTAPEPNTLDESNGKLKGRALLIQRVLTLVAVAAGVATVVGVVPQMYGSFVPESQRTALFCRVFTCITVEPSPTANSQAIAQQAPGTTQQGGTVVLGTTQTVLQTATPAATSTATSIPSQTPSPSTPEIVSTDVVTATDPSIYFERLPYLCEYRSTTNEFINLDPYDAGSVLLNKQSQAEIRTWPLAARHFDFENNQQIYGMDMGLRISTTNPSAQNGSIVATAPFTITTILKRSIEGDLVEVVSRCRQDIASASPPHFDSQRILLSLNTAKLQNGLAQKLPEGLIASDELNSLKMHCRAPGVYQAIIQVGYSFAGKQGQVAHATEELVCPRIFRIWFVNELNVPQGMPSHRLEHQSIMYEWSENAQTYLPASDAVYSAKDPRPQFGPIYVCGDSERFNDKNDKGGCPFLTTTFGNKTRLIHITWRLRNMTQGLEVRRQWLQDRKPLCNEKTNIIGDPNQSGWELDREFAHTRLVAEVGKGDAGECGLKASKEGYLVPGVYILRIFIGKSDTPEREISFTIANTEKPAQ